MYFTVHGLPGVTSDTKWPGYLNSLANVAEMATFGAESSVPFTVVQRLEGGKAMDESTYIVHDSILYVAVQVTDGKEMEELDE